MRTHTKKEIGEAIRKIWESLESHLDATYNDREWKFHAECVVDYSKQIAHLSNLLKRKIK